MAQARLLQAVCTVALLAAAPAFAQTATPPAGASATPRSAAPSSMAPAEKMGTSSDSGASADTHRSTMNGHRMGAMHGRTDTSQNAAVDQLNEQSYQAAQNGQAFSVTDSGSSGTMAPTRSGRMNGMSGGTAGAPPSSAASGAGGGSGTK
jgi:hypothetical protein